MSLIHHHQPPVPPSRVVVLGSRGFVASHTVAHLESLGLSVEGISSSAIDLTDSASVDALRTRLGRDDVLVFVSALTPDRGRDIRTLMRNLRMAEHVAAALAEAPCAHVVYVGSDAVYADDANPVNEESVQSPASFHGLMHFARERMLHESLKASGTPIAFLRPSLLYGVGDTHGGYGPNRFLRTALVEGTIALFGQGEERRDHVLVDDVARIIGLAVLGRSEGALNVATGTSASFAEVAACIAAQRPGTIRIEHRPRAAGPVTHRHFDVTATVKAWPTFAYIPLAEGLARTWRALAQN
jgi:nucleoside-diphosphate-sugar epimerase